MGRSQWESEHLWLYLLALGFRPERHHGVRLGRDMFAKPNMRAFYVIARFLFTKLDKRRSRQMFRYSRQVFRHSRFRTLSSPGLRKHCCLWLREISRQKETGLPRITPSTLICPGGDKFVHVVYCFARYVMIEEIKKLSVGTRIPFAEAVMRRPDDMFIAEARHRVAYNKLLQILQREDFVVQEYRKKAKVLIREINQTKSEYAVLQEQSLRMKQNDQTRDDTTEKIQKVRSMWTLLVETLTSLRKEKEVVDSVLEDCVNPCVLDGTDVVLRVPGLLTYRVENNIDGFCTGNLYEDGKLNFLTVIRLLNEALMTLRDERCPCELKELHRIEDMVTSYKSALQELNTSLRRREQHCEPKHQSISKREEIWELKWKTILGQCPFNLIFKDDLQSASSLQCFSSSDEDEDSIFCQSFSDSYDSRPEEFRRKNDGSLETVKDAALVPSRCDFMQHGGLSPSEATHSHFLSPFLRSSVPSLSEASANRDLLTENNLHTCMGNKKPVTLKILKSGKEEFPTSEIEANAGENVTQPKSPVKKEDLLEKARDELAEKIAKVVVSESPDSGEEKGMAFDDLIRSLSFNPFLMRKQMPQTPENLRTEISSSWTKAIQTEGSLHLELSSAELVTEESSINATPSMQEEGDCSIVCSEPAFSASDLDPPVSEKKSQLSSTKSSSQEQVSVSHTSESSDSKPSEIQESERTESEELDYSTLSGSSLEDLSQTLNNVEKSMNIPDTSLKSRNPTYTLPSGHSRGSLMDAMLCWNISALNSVSHETADLGILDETLPESDSIDLSISAGSDSVFYTVDSENVMDSSEKNEDVKKLDLDVQSLSSSHEMITKTASKSEEELHQTHNGNKSESYRAELSPVLQEGEENDDDPSMDEGFTKMPLPSSPNERKYSLSSLLASCQQVVHEVPLDLLHKLKDKNS